MIALVDLATGPDFTLSAATCRDDHSRWSPAEHRDDFRVVLVRRGRFRRRAAGRSAVIDPTVAYVGVPGEEERFAHPAGGDVCTAVTLTPARWRSLAGEATGATVYVDAALDLAHRRVLAAARSGDADYALAERLTAMLARMTGRSAPGASPADRALVAAAREAIGAGDSAAGRLFDLAARLGASPYRLSRAFTRELGVSLTRYRNRVRVGRAIDRLAAGEPSLAVLAADLGFADQAHLTRTVRDHLGATPTALRRLLS